MALNLSMTRGTTGVWYITVYQYDGTTPQDLTGSTLTFNATVDDVNITKSSPSSGITITNAVAGLATLTIDAADTTDVNDDGTFVGSCELQLTSSGDPYELNSGTLTVYPNVVFFSNGGGGSGGTIAFSAITTGTNTSAAMVVGTGAVLTTSGSGIINATSIDGISITGTPSVGYVPTATSASAATWQAPAGGGGTPASPDAAVQFNSLGSFGGSSFALLNSSGHVAYGSTATINGPNAFGDNVSQPISISHTITAIDPVSDYAMNGGTVAVTLNLADDTSYEFDAWDVRMTTDPTSTHAVSYMQGQFMVVERLGNNDGINNGGQAVYVKNTGDGNLSDGLYGYFANLENGGSGAVSRVQSVLVQNGNAGSGTITDSYTIKIAHSYNSGAGTVTNNVGLLIEDQSPVGSTLHRNLWSQGSGSDNLFEGRVAVDNGLITTVVAVASLPAAPVEGMRAFVNNSNAASFTAGIGTVVAGGGSTHVPVFYDGTNWRIG